MVYDHLKPNVMIDNEDMTLKPSLIPEPSPKSHGCQ